MDLNGGEELNGNSELNGWNYVPYVFARTPADNLTLNDLSRIQRRLVIKTDASDLTDSKFSTLVKLRGDVVTVNDAGVTRQWTVVATAAIGLFDAFVKVLIASGVVVTRVTGETVVVSDGVTSWVYRRRDFSDLLTMFDGSTTYRQRISQLSETLAVVDSAIAYKLRRRLSEDTTTIADSLLALTARLRTVLSTETIGVSDAGRTVSWGVLATGGMTLIDSFIKSLVTAGGITTRVVGENVVISSAAFDWVLRRRDVTDLVDVLEGDGWSLIEAFSDTVIVSDSLVVSILRSLRTIVATENISVNDAGRTVSWGVTATATLSVLDSFIKSIVGGGITTTRVVGENIVVTDGVSFWLLRRRDLTDILSITESNRTFHTDVITDRIDVLDSFIKTLINGSSTVIRVVNENLGVTGELGTTRLFSRADVLDALAITDAVSKYRNFGRVATDPITIQDELRFWRRLVRLTEEAVTLIDGFIKSVIGAGALNVRIVTDALIIADASGRFVTRLTLASEAVQLTDAQFHTLQRIRNIVDSADISDGYLSFKMRRSIISELLNVTDEAIRVYLPYVTVAVRIRLGQELPGIVLGVDEPVRLSAEYPITLGADDVIQLSAEYPITLGGTA